MADHPLRSATDRRLGGPLPRQLTNQTQVHPVPINLWPVNHVAVRYHKVLITVSSGYPFVQGRLPTRYSPVRRFPLNPSSEDFIMNFSLDLHVLGTPPAFILSQDQTLEKNGILPVGSPICCVAAALKPTSEYLDSFQTRCAWITLYLRIVRVVPTQLISWQYYCDEILYIYKIFVLCSFQCSCRPVRVGLYIIAPLQLSVKNFFIFFWKRFKSRWSHSWRKNAETNWNCRRLTV